MSASLFVAIPLALFAVVLLLCFVGCDVVFGIDAFAPPYTKYTPDILAEPTLVAYWPLGEPAGETTAVDVKSALNGTYLSQVFPDDPSFPSAAAPGTLTLGQSGIVPGNTLPPFDNPDARTTCIEVNGGYVSIPFDAALNPSKADGFSVEAWVQVGWSPTDTAATRVIMVSFDAAGGYALFASPANTWQGLVGGTFARGPEVVFDATSHLVLTYDGSLLRLFVNGSQATADPANYQPSTQSRLFIGAGGPNLPEPRGPWVGKIQCVAVYKGALSPEQVATHFAHGNGATPS
jgi:hypothetical protein